MNEQGDGGPYLGNSGGSEEIEQAQEQSIKRVAERLADALERKLSNLPQEQRIKALSRINELLEKGGDVDWRL